MEPLRGGDLVGPHSPAIGRIWTEMRPKRKPVDWLLRWLWDQPEVSIVLNGMSSMGQLEQNAAIASKARADTLTAEQRHPINRVRTAYRRQKRIPCTGCAYCMPCPSGVAIPRCFAVYNDSCMFPDTDTATTVYNLWMPEKNRAASCTGCGRCLKHCPQQIDIPEQLRLVDRKLARK